MFLFSILYRPQQSEVTPGGNTSPGRDDYEKDVESDRNPTRVSDGAGVTDSNSYGKHIYLSSLPIY